MIAKPIRRSQIKRRRTGTRRSSRVLNPAYLDFLRTLPCWACFRDVYRKITPYMGDDMDELLIAHTQQALYGRQKSPTEAAHVGFAGKPRGMSQKCSDAEAIPLCCEHHREGEFSIHNLGPSAFFELHGADRDATIRMFNSLYAEHCR